MLRAAMRAGGRIVRPIEPPAPARQRAKDAALVALRAKSRVGVDGGDHRRTGDPVGRRTNSPPAGVSSTRYRGVPSHGGHKGCVPSVPCPGSPVRANCAQYPIICAERVSRPGAFPAVKIRSPWRPRSKCPKMNGISNPCAARAGGAGARQRIDPTGGAAYGIPSHAALPYGPTKPTTSPLVVVRRSAGSGAWRSGARAPHATSRPSHTTSGRPVRMRHQCAAAAARSRRSSSSASVPSAASSRTARLASRCAASAGRPSRRASSASGLRAARAACG
jgi:hypothetical protein